MKLEQKVFWDEFIQSTWQIEGCVIDNFSDSDLISEEQVFEIFLRSFNTFLSKKGTRATIKIYLDGELVTPTQYYDLDCSPLPTDKNYANFYERVKPNLPGDELCIVVDRAELDPETRDWVYNLLGNVYGRLGKVAPGSFAFFFLGQYSQTPFGIHRHDCAKECDSTFIFNIRGQKSIWLWEKGYDIKNPDMPGSKDVEKYESDAKVITATPGDAIYFPSFMPHIGESAITHSQNIFIATKPAADAITEFFGYIQFVLEDYLEPDTLRTKLNIIQSLSKSYFKKTEQINQIERDTATLPFCEKQLVLDVNMVPDSLNQAEKYLTGVIEKSLLRLLKVKFWLSVLSSYGLISRTSTENQKVDIGSKVQLLRHHRIVRCYLEKSIVVGAAGATMEFDIAHRDLVDVICDMSNTHKELSVENIIGRWGEQGVFSGASSQILSIINKINSLNVFQVK